MPDPIDELENFSIPGPAMTPLPAADVRRRGDKIRRRNNTLAAVGGLAAVAVIAAPFAIFAGGQQSDTTPGPATQPPHSWTTTIPDSFAIDALPEDATFEFEVVDGSTVDDVSLCGVTAFSTAPATDTAGATWTELGSSGATDRTLAVYPDDTAAQGALDDFRQAVLDCGRDEQPTAGLPLVNDVVDVAVPGAEDALVYTNQAKDGALLSDMTAYEVVRVGNALYVANSHTTAGGEQAMSTVDGLIANSAPVVDQLCLFSAAGCGDDDQAVDPSIGEGAVPAIPGDFPLDAGLPTSATEDEVPSPEPTACDESIAVPDTVVETSHAQWRDVSQIQDRQLMTFATQADALAYVDSIVGIFCVEDDKGRGASRVTRVYPADLGDYAMAAVGHNELDGEVDAGLVLTQVVRVGRAVLLAQRIDEGYAWAGDVDQESGVLVTDTFSDLSPAIDAMCAFTEAGC